MADRLILDSSFLYALFDQSDKNHAIAVKSIQPDGTLLIPEITLTEVAFLFRRAVGVPAVADFLANLMGTDPLIVGLEKPGFLRASEIMRHYK